MQATPCRRPEFGVVRGCLEEGVDEPPSFVERLLGALVLPLGVDITLFLALAVLRPLRFGNGLYPRAFYFTVLAFLGITVIRTIVGFIAGIYRSFWILDHFWSVATPRDGRATAIVWLCVALAGLAGFYVLRSFINP